MGYVQSHGNFRTGLQRRKSHLLKSPIVQMPTFSVIEVNLREEKPPRQPTPRIAAMESARKIMQEMSDQPTGDKTFLVYGPRHSTEECKVLKEYSKNYNVQRTHKESRYDGKNKHVKSVKFDGNTQ